MVTLSKTNQDAVVKKITAIISDLQKQIDKNQSKMDQIDEEYRLKALAKKESLLAETTTLTEEVKYWNIIITDRYGLSIDDATIAAEPVAEEPVSTATESTEMTDLFTSVVATAAASTEPQPEPEEIVTVPAAPEVPAEESATDALPFSNPAIEEEEEKEEEEEEEDNDDDDLFNDEDTETVDPTDVEWAEDFPEDWKD